MIDKTYGFLKKIQEHNSPHSFTWFGTVSSSISSGSWATALTDWLGRKEITIASSDVPSTLTNYPLTIKIQGDADLMEKTTETEEEIGSFTSYTETQTQSDVIKGTGVVDFDIGTTASDDCVWKDLTSISDTKWVMDWDLDYTSFVHNSDASSMEMHVGLSSIDGTNSIDVSQDGILFGTTNESGAGDIFRLFWGNAENIRNNAVVLSPAVTVEARKYFMRLVRYSDTNVTGIVYADKARTIELGRAVVTNLDASGVQTLRYLRIQEWNSDGTGNGTVIGTVSNVRFWDGITNPVNQEVVTFTDSFAGTDDWVDDDANTGVNIGTDVLDWDSLTSSSHDSASIYDLGVGAVDNKYWTLQGKIILDTVTTNTDATPNLMAFGISSKDETFGQDGTHDFIGLRAKLSSSTSTWHQMDVDNTSIAAVDGAVFTRGVTAETIYVRIVRNGSNCIVGMYSDSSYSILLEEQTGAIGGTVESLRYIKIVTGNVGGSANGALNGTLDDVEFWDGITSPNAEGRKIVFTDNAFNGDTVEYASETVSYDPINGNLEAVVKIPSLSSSADTVIQMYYDYTPSATPSYVPELIPITGTLDDNFSSDSWTDSGTENSVGTNVLDWDAMRDGTINKTVYDFGAGVINDDLWMLRFKFVVDANDGTGTIPYLFVGISDADETVGATGANNGLYMQLQGTSINDIQFKSLSASDDLYNGTVEYTFTQAPAVGTYYIEIKKTGNALGIMNIYSDSAYTILTETSGELGLNVTDSMRYLFVGNYNSGTTADNFNGTIDDMTFHNNITSFDREPRTYDSDYKAVYHFQGNALDSTSNNNDGTETVGTYEQQNNSVGFNANAATSKVDMGSDASIDGIFVGGGNITWDMVIRSDGGANTGKIFIKDTGWSLQTVSQSGSNVGLQMVKDFSTSWFIWNTTVDVPIDTVLHCSLTYDEDSAANDPTILINGTSYTVGSGITEAQAGSGSSTSDAANNLFIANITGGNNAFDGYINNVRLSDVTRSADEYTTNYNATKSSSTMFTVGSENTQ